MWSIFKRRRQAKAHVEALYSSIVDAARQPVFYRDMGVPDTAEGRFEIIALHVILAVDRLNGQGEAGKAVGQNLFEHFFKDMDYAMREMGIGDTSIGKKVRAMAEVFFGRFKAYLEARDADESDALSAMMARNIFETEADRNSDRLAAYCRASEQHLSGRDLLAPVAPDSQLFPAADGS
ncbi:ubiquinol-cytochrome C chaperone family protein [Hyphobacterium sp. HN65]|uniref:Ubiquinol-cytochrome C chaperone family protein n=1 Tax=Hyphobacterium lacteum TaxID=3116575 RepID=A0ABU7LM64_9PROT|nr:ubiquinol-cytochrome C chaperone family protein [Hyphobacterium sp. HN65]MEE2525015.1 ubiquinol-cytochrome C chaperone family protein [Hyphobacterium sp. HN65]